MLSGEYESQALDSWFVYDLTRRDKNKPNTTTKRCNIICFNMLYLFVVSFFIVHPVMQNSHSQMSQYPLKMLMEISNAAAFVLFLILVIY